MKRSTVVAEFPCDCKTVWDIVTDNKNYRWRSDLSRIEVINETCFDEYTKEGFVTRFRITEKEPYRIYRFAMENKNMCGNWIGLFEKRDGGTQITFTEEVQVKNPIMNLFVKPEYRGKGYGKAILKKLAAIAVERGCGRLEWWCLDWNKPGIDFYLSLGAEPMDDWTVYRITGDTLSDLASF